MEIRSAEEAKKDVETFALEYLRILERKKQLDEEIKDLKSYWKENGVPTNVVCKGLNNIKSRKKKSQSEQFEQETIEEWLITNKDIDSTIVALMAK